MVDKNYFEENLNKKNLNTEYQYHLEYPNDRESQMSHSNQKEAKTELFEGKSPYGRNFRTNNHQTEDIFESFRNLNSIEKKFESETIQDQEVMNEQGKNELSRFFGSRRNITDLNTPENSKKTTENDKKKRYNEKRAIIEFLSSADGIDKILDLGREFNTQFMSSGTSDTESIKKMSSSRMDDLILAIVDIYACWSDNASIKSVYGKDLYSLMKKIEDVAEKQREKYGFLK